ncbi:MAG: ABC transporter ATP-binding protein [Betaproteobacteria bacterium]
MSGAGGSSGRLVRRYVLTEPRAVIGLAVVVFTAMAARVGLPYLAGRFVDEAGAGTSLAILMAIGSAFLVLGLANQVLSVAGTRLSADLGWRASNRLRADLLAHTLRLDLEFHAEHPPGELVERIDGDARELNGLLSEFSVSLLANLLTIAGTLAVLLLLDWRIGLVMVGFAALALVVFGHVRDTASPYWRRSREATTRLYGASEEYFAGLDDLRGNGAVDHAVRDIDDAQRVLFHRQRRATAMSALVGSGAELVLTLGAVAILGIAVAFYVHGALTVGMVVTVSLFTALISQPLQNVVDQVDAFQQALASITRVDDLLGLTPSIRDGAGVTFPAGACEVEFDGVSLCYPGAGGVAAVRDVSVRVAAGQTLAIVGRTGAGKTTIARLLVRLYDPTTGRILVGGHDIRQATLAQLRRRIGIVTQEVQLFQLTVRDNLTLLDDSVPDVRLTEFLDEVGLGPWFRRQPYGLDTVLPAGGGLSAGEAQLLAAVRVFVADPGVVILDEPTSRLDPATEALVARAFARVTAGRTALVIAHRLETVARADTVLVLDAGQVVELGGRAALAVDPSSRFARLLSASAQSAVDGA